VTTSPYLERNQRPLSDILGVAVDVKVVDLGADRRIGGAPPYAPLFLAGRAEVVGFEPNPDAFAHLQAAKGPRETYLPLAAGDGETHTLHVCHAPGMTSLFAPDPAVLDLFHGFPGWGRVTRTEAVRTVRLDDVPETAGMHYIKLDIQGAELMALSHATERLRGCLVVHSEVEFLPLYKDQPLFAEVDQFLRRHGFAFHKFAKHDVRMVQPLLFQNDVYRGLSQLTAAEAVFVRDLTKLADRTAADLLRLAAILHDCYGSWDVVFRLLLEHDRRFASRFAPPYLDALQESMPAPG
jgi:FkbM family methyltransferase